MTYQHKGWGPGIKSWYRQVMFQYDPGPPVTILIQNFFHELIARNWLNIAATGIEPERKDAATL